LKPFPVFEGLDPGNKILVHTQSLPRAYIATSCKQTLSIQDHLFEDHFIPFKNSLIKYYVLFIYSSHLYTKSNTRSNSGIAFFRHREMHIHPLPSLQSKKSFNIWPRSIYLDY